MGCHIDLGDPWWGCGGHWSLPWWWAKPGPRQPLGPLRGGVVLDSVFAGFGQANIGVNGAPRYPSVEPGYGGEDPGRAVEGRQRKGTSPGVNSLSLGLVSGL